MRIDEASLSKECFEYLVARHYELQENATQIKFKSPLDGSMHNEIKTMTSNVIEYKEPSSVVMKGRTKRLKSLNVGMHKKSIDP